MLNNNLFYNTIKEKSKINNNYIIYIKCNPNNTFISYNINKTYNVSLGSLGFTGFKKKTFFAAIALGKHVGINLKNNGINKIDVKIKGIPTKLTGIFKGIIESGITIQNIYDITPIPFNGCKKRKIYF